MIRNTLFFSIIALFVFQSCGKDDEGGETGNGGNEETRITIAGATKFEGDEQGQTFLDFKVRLTQASSEEVRVDYSTKDLAATAGEDYIAQTGTLTFEAMALEKIISIEIVTDTLKESDEDFAVELSNPVNATFSKDEAIGNIRNDDTFQVIPDDGYISADSYAGMTKVWEDDFCGTSINSGNWTHELGATGWGNQELQNYTASPENSYVNDCKLVIEAKSQNGGYTSARMITANKFDFKYGRVDIRAKLPKGQGIWPALWMLGSDFWDISWPQCGEIDIMEIVGHEPARLHGTAHWEQNGHASHGDSIDLEEGDFSDEFHVFSIRWDEQSIKWYLDDVQYNALNITSSPLNEFHTSFFFIFNVAVGGDWPGSPDASTEFPQQMIVDYVRVFQEN